LKNTRDFTGGVHELFDEKKMASNCSDHQAYLKVMKNFVTMGKLCLHQQFEAFKK
jgi:hypothetical protein